MAAKGEQGAEEYESDPEDAPLPSMRRREASDDEDCEGGSDGGRRPVRKELGSDGEADWQGSAQVYDEEEDEVYYDDEDYEELGEDEVEGDLLHGEREEVEGADGADLRNAAEGKGGSPKKAAEQPLEAEGVHDRSVGDAAEHEETQGEGEEKKEKEAYSVPTAGAFYMHDDRFQESGRGRRRRMFGGRKLWDSKDESAWVHDRFEEMNIHDDEERRRSRGRFRGRGRGRNRGGGRGYARGPSTHKYYEDGNKQNNAPITVKGRGPTRYDSVTKKVREIRGTQQKQSLLKPPETTSNNKTVSQSSQAANLQPDPIVPHKHVFASSLNSASPPFYPSGSSNQDMSTQKKGTHPVNTNKTLSYSMQMDDSSMVPQSTSLMRGRAVIDSIGNDKSYTSDTHRYASGKSLPSSYPVSSGLSLSSTNAVQPSGSVVQGRRLNGNVPTSNQHTSSLNQVGRSSGSSIQGQSLLGQQRPTQTPVQSALHISTQHLPQRPSSGNQASSPPSTYSSEAVETGPPKSTNSLVAKGKPGQGTGSGTGTFLYGGTQVIGATGAMGIAHGDQNFPGTPALLPVMQFGGQHPGGLGVPAMGMALPGYVARPQLGFGNSEMTWVPVLAGGAGALGSSYPYITLDGSFYARPPGQSSPSSAARDVNTSKQTASKPSQPEIVNDELGQRQNKPRRYSEMSFGQ